MELKAQAWARTDTGLKRGNNEDSHCCEVGHGIFLVCDGMGGREGGERASAEAVRLIREYLVSSPPGEGGPRGREQLLGRVMAALQAANDGVYQLSLAEQGLKGMGTTASLLVLRGNRGYLAHVGDSRIYLQRAGEVHQLTHDHTFLAELARRQHSFTPEQLALLPYGQALTRAVGVQPAVQVDTAELELLPGDRLLLCSDGLHRYLGEQPQLLADLLAEGGGDASVLPQLLVDFALEQGGEDNVTVLVVELSMLTPSQALLEQTREEYRSVVGGMSRAELFRFLQPQQLLEVLAATEVCSYRKGETIFSQGEQGDAMYVVVSGAVDVLVDGVQVSMLGPGNHFGELALVAGFGRSATVVAVRDVKLRRLGREAFNRLLADDPILSTRVLWSMVGVLARQSQQSNQEIVQLQQENARLRAELRGLGWTGPDEEDDLPGEPTLVQLAAPSRAKDSASRS